MCQPVTQAKPASLPACAPVRARPRLLVWLAPALLALAMVALYWPVTHFDFVNYDDDFYVTSNLHVQNGVTWEGLRWACANPVAANWHPVTVWSHMLVCHVFGLRSWAHHLVSAVLHALNAALVFVLLRQMTGATWRSLCVAILFAAHPLRVESVAWVAERKDVLSGFFGLLALLAYARYAVGGQRTEVSRWWAFSHLPSSIFYLLSLCCYALGLMSKPMLVTWPFLMLMLDYWPLKRMESVECRLSTLRSRTATEDGQNAEASNTQHPSTVAALRRVDASRITFHVSRFSPR